MKIATKPHLLFVYNADSTPFAQMTDFVHKIVAPDSYRCNLCKLTYGSFKMKQQWLDFIQSLPIPVSFLHKDELAKAYPDLIGVPLPAVFRVEDAEQVLWISSDEINDMADLDSLIRLFERQGMPENE